jgi:uncharacterized membrane protein YhaH (DUF805 family)
MVALLFSYKGRINRLQYWTGNIIVGLGGVFAIFGLGALLGPAQLLSKDSQGVVQALSTLGIVIGPVSLLMAWAGLALQVKRFHDRGRSGLFTLLPLLPMMLLMITLVGEITSGAPPATIGASIQPYVTMLWIINLAFFIDLGCLPGKEGPNRYGNPPGSAPSAPAPAPSKSIKVIAASTGAAFGSAEQAIDRALAARARAPAVTPVAAAAFAAAPKPAASGSFGRRRAH